MSAAKQRPHYVNNKDFSNAVVEYVRLLQQCEKDNLPKPMLPNYIAECFLKICEGLSHKANFVRYTYREEMVMDAVENCLKSVDKFDPDTATRSGNLNAFSYFTQISWYAFLRRIQKEKKQMYIRFKSSQQMIATGGTYAGGEDVTLNLTTSADYMNSFVQDYEDKIARDKAKRTSVPATPPMATSSSDFILSCAFLSLTIRQTCELDRI